ncbi:hypothetical protein GGR21_003229 [Dysgonomonas hofstadii]|uniref:Uncharacterized protein n=1 Tax=Dysgonomonas hofstadii TaxID=637886 RepID=A0A840CY17_9BACT|nr:hypothetical protein [Dysgonomonas hofstadii]MBB4037312.1 hypothetical protein [Dysgonomonas hofstadii]
MVSHRFRRVGTPAADMMPESQYDDKDYPALGWLRPVALSRSAGHLSGERGVKWKASAGQSFHLAREPVTGRTEGEPPKSFWFLLGIWPKGTQAISDCA